MLISVPEAWGDVRTEPVTAGDGEQSVILASPDLAGSAQGVVPRISITELVGSVDRSGFDALLIELSAPVAPTCAGALRIPYGEGRFPDSLFEGEMAV
jgi:hypothetical protein